MNHNKPLYRYRFPVRGILATLGLLLLLVLYAPIVQSQEPRPVEDLVSLTGERLRVLADPINFQIGYASRTGYQGEDHGDRFERIVKTEFNVVTPENSLKWENVHPLADAYDFAASDMLIEFAEQNDMAFHGHTLLWHRQNPMWLENVSEEDLEDVMNQHIDTLVGRYAGKVQVWDVVNEAFNDGADGGFRDNIWFNAMGKDYIEKAFVRAHAADPLARLIYNDNDVGWLTPKADDMYALVEELVNKGVPIHGVGFQMHIKVDFTAFEELSTNMQRFADLGLDVYITEFDVQSLRPSQYQLQADVYQEVLRRCLAQPRCKALQIWGVDDYSSWLPWFEPLPFDKSYNAKPAYYGMQRALTTTVVNLEDFSSSTDIVVKSGTVSPLRFGSSLKLDQVDLDAIYQSVTLRYANGGSEPASVDIRLDEADGGLLARVETEPTGSLGNFETVTVDIPQALGKRDIHILFNTESADFQLDYIIFEDPDEDAIAANVPAVLPTEPTGTPTDPNGSVSGGSNPGADSGGGGSVSFVILLLLALSLVWRRVYTRSFVSTPSRLSTTTT